MKSLFLANEAATPESVRQYVDPRMPTSIQPLAYMGILDGVTTSPHEICELWLGPCGVQYYHVHERDDPEWIAFTGGNPIARNKNPGRLYIGFTTAQQDWVNLALRSALRYFPKAARYGVNVVIRTEPGATEYLMQMDSAAQAEAERIAQMPDEKTMSPAINLAFDHRFMPKLALGLSYNMFGKTFATSSYADKLRGQMWAKTHDERASFGIRGLNYLESGKDPTNTFIAFKGGYTIRIMAVRQELVLSINLPTSRPIHIVMADDPRLWSEPRFSSYQLGVVFVIVPQVERFAGPFGLAPYVGHLMRRAPLPELQSIEALKVDLASLPSCR